MKRLIILVAATLFVIVANISCNNDTVAQDTKSQDSIKYIIETNRTVIVLDTTKITYYKKERLLSKLNYDKRKFVNGVKLALDYELNKGFEIIHFIRDRKLDCSYICPDIYAQLTSVEYDNLTKRFRKMSWGKYEDEVKDSKGIKYQRTLVYTVSGIMAFLETDEKCCKEDISLYIDALTQTITFHQHHHHFCQTDFDKYIYEEAWRYQHNK